MVASGAALASVAIITFYESKAGPNEGPAGARSRAPQSGSLTSAESANEQSVGRAEWALRGAPEPGEPNAGANAASANAAGANASEPGTGTPTALQAEKLRAKLAEVMRERRDLETQLRTLEGELARSAEVPPTGDPRDFDLDREDWKALAAEGRIKYRIPCVMPSNGAYTTPQEDLDALGLSPEDGQALTEAHRRSNARVWGTVRPLCLKAVGKADVVDLLGVSSCLRLIESAATSSDFMAAADERRRVAEMHAGMTPPPREGEPQSPLFAALMAVTSEAERFQADLAESFGPEEGKRIAESMRCVATVR